MLIQLLNEKRERFNQKLKSCTPQIVWDRIENLAVSGVPDLLGYNKNNKFFTIETKLAKVNSVKFRPHQIAWHVRHPANASSCFFTETPNRENFKSTSIHDLQSSDIKPEPRCAVI